MPQLNLLRQQQPLTFGIAVGVPSPESSKRANLIVTAGDGTGRLDFDGIWRLPSGDLCDVGAVIHAAWLQWWYGEPHGLGDVVERELREHNLLGTTVRRR